MNQKDREGNTPLVTAIKRLLNVNINNEVIRRLVQEKGVDVNSADNMGNAPLHYAVRVSLVVTKWLLEREDIIPNQPGRIGRQQTVCLIVCLVAVLYLCQLPTKVEKKFILCGRVI